MKESSELNHLIDEIHHCVICREHLPLGPNPVVQLGKNSKILVVGQAPGIRVHNTGIAFNDASGERLREWMGVTNEEFYNRHLVSLLPMGFCYPGKGKSGDLPPRKECAPFWREQIIQHLSNIKLTLVIGKYAQNWHLYDAKAKTLTQTVKDWQQYSPTHIPMPHPSPRNNIWLAKNPWFDLEVVPYLRQRVNAILGK